MTTQHQDGLSDERAAFEAWIRRDIGANEDNFRLMSDGQYGPTWLRDMYLAYCEGRAIEAEAIAPLKAQIAELEKVLDWLSRNCKTSTIYMDGRQPWVPNHRVMHLVGTSFIEAVKEAINRKPTRRPEDAPGFSHPQKGVAAEE